MINEQKLKNISIFFMMPRFKKIFSLDAADLYLILAFFFLFTLLTPMGQYKPSIPKKIDTGYYSVIKIDFGDDAGHYAWLRSFFFDGDFDFFNEQKFAHFDRILSTGYVFNHWPIGPAIFWTPFFLLGHSAALFLSQMGLNISLDGYSFPYYMSTAIGSTLFSFGGIFLLSTLLCRFYSKKVAHVASFIVFASTGLIYFTFIRQRMAHSLEFFLIVLFLFLWFKARDHQYNSQWMVLWGISLGALALTRYSDITFFIIPGLDFFHRLFTSRNDKVQLNTVLKTYFLFFISFLITIIPLLIVWKILNGVPFPLSWVDYPSHFVSFDFWDILKKLQHFFIGRDWGIFLCEPVWLIAIPGFWFFLKKDYYLGVILLAAAVFPIYISANPGGGAAEISFGHRFALAANPILSFGLAAFLSRSLSVKYGFKTLFLLCIFFVAYKYIQLLQFNVFLRWNDPLFTLNSIKNIPILLKKYLFWTHSSSLWKILFHLNKFEGLDMLFLVIFPLSVFMCMILMVIGFNAVSTHFSAKHGLGAVSVVLLGLYLVVYSAYKPKSSSEIIARYFDGAKVQLFSRKDTSKAVSYLERALEMDANNITLLNSLGEIHADLMGNMKSAIYYFEKSLALSPDQKDSEFIKLKLKNLKENG